MERNILITMPSLHSGGAEKSLISLLTALPKDMFDIDLMVVNKGGLFYNMVPDGINIIEAPRSFRIALGRLYEMKSIDWGLKCISNVLLRLSRLSNLKTLQFTWMMWHKIIPDLHKSYDVAVSFMDSMTNYYVIEKVNAKRKYLWVHNDYKKLNAYAPFDAKFFSKADNVVTISNLCVQSLKETFPDLKDKFIAIENISSKKLIDKMADEFYPEEYKGIEDKTIILSIGRLVEQKGFDLAVKAAKNLKEKGVHFQWFIIGVGGLKENLKAYILQNDLQNYFELLGERPNPYPYIKYCNLFLQTSRFEGKSIVVDEAKILNKPIISTNYPTVKDNIQDGQSGIICEISPEAIANAIIALNQDESKQRHIISHLKKYCNGNEDEVEKYIKLFCRTHNQKVLSI